MKMAKLEPFFQQARESVSTSLQNLVQPVSDTAYYQHVTRHDEQEEEDSDWEEDDESNKEEQEDFSFEEDELVDEDVLERAKVLRNQVRLASQRVDRLRTSCNDSCRFGSTTRSSLVGGSQQGRKDDEEPLDAATNSTTTLCTNNNDSSKYKSALRNEEFTREFEYLVARHQDQSAGNDGNAARNH